MRKFLATLLLVATLVSLGPPETAQAAAPSFVNAASAIVTSTSGTTITVDKPTDTQEGDVMIAIIGYRTEEAARPTGWDVVETVTSNWNSVTYVKVAGAAEPSDYTWTQEIDGGRIAGIISTYRGVDTTTPVDVSGGNPEGSTGTDHTAPSVTTTVADTRVVRAWRNTSPSSPTNNVISAPASETERAQVNDSNVNRPSLTLADASHASTGATGTSVGTTPEAVSRRGSHTIALAPEDAGEEPAAPAEIQRVFINVLSVLGVRP